MPVYEIARWAEVFETAESRKLKSLAWIAERTDFDSTGWQTGLDEFGPVEWPRVYGNWMILVRVAAKGKVRGRLSGDKGEAWTAARIVRPSGCDAAGVQTAIDFAVKIGWLIPIEDISGDLRENLPERREKNTATEHDTTRQNKTRDDTTRPEKPVPSRPVDFENQNAGIAGAAAVKPPNPEAVPLLERARKSPLLAWLGEQIIKPGDGTAFAGRKPFSVIDSTLKGSSLQPEWWLQWYTNQLAANGKLRGANMAEACFVLAAAIAVRESFGKALNKPAAWVKMVADRNTQFIADEHFSAAAIHCEKFFSVAIPPELFGVAPAKLRKETQYTTAPAATKKMTAEELAKLRTRTAEAKKRILKNAATH